jgi:presenilin-like A22 family membrane protease
MKKENIKVAVILIGMFFITQLLGLFIVNFYMNDGVSLPYGFEEPKDVYKADTSGVQYSFLGSFLPSLIIVLFIFFILMRIKSAIFIRGWFFIVITLALGITISVLTLFLGIEKIVYGIPLIASIIAITLAYFKILKRNILVHNLTELMVYPGIAAIFVAMLNLTTTIILLVIISIYDIWAVWHSKVMVKMAKFQINKVGVFSGFFLPYASKKMKDKIEFLKMKYKNSKIPESVVKKQKIKVGLAILGGGDVIFPIIAAGVFFKTFHSLPATLWVTAGATLALLYLFVFGEKKKFYPAMPYLTTGIFAGMFIAWRLLAM